MLREKNMAQGSQQGRCRQRGRWEAVWCKFGSDHTCSAIFVEELISLATVAAFLRHEKTFSIPRYISESQDHHTLGKKPLQEMCSVHFIITFCSISGIYKLLWERRNFTGKKKITLQFGDVFYFTTILFTRIIYYR
jgi:hypothetical protein